MTFKQYIENLWGNIPAVRRKPSDGRGGQAMNPSSPKQQGQAGSPGAPSVMPDSQQMMMKKNMKKMKKH